MRSARSVATAAVIAALLSAGGMTPAFAASEDEEASGSARLGKSNIAYNIGDREVLVHAPASMLSPGVRPLVVVLHGGMGNAKRISTGRSESGMNLDAMSDKYGFIVAYLNGTPVTRLLGNDKKGWNAGLCCGKPADDKVDDVRYILNAVQYLAGRYGVDTGRIYAVGHSNGAMMAQRVVCEAGLFASVISISGTLNLETTNCRAARGRQILEIHGEKDTNVPLQGGYGDGVGAKYYKKSQAYAQQVFESSGGKYTLQIYPGAAHKLSTLEKAIEEQDKMSMQEKITRFFGLVRQ